MKIFKFERENCKREIPEIFHIENIPFTLRHRFLPVVVLLYFPWKCCHKCRLSQQQWCAIKTPTWFLRLVFMMAHLMTCTVKLSGIVRPLINPTWRNKIRLKMALFYTHARTSCVHSKWKPRRQSHTAIWNLTQDSLNLAHMYGLTFGDRNAPKRPVLSMTYPQIGLCSAVTSKTRGCTKCLQ